MKMFYPLSMLLMSLCVAETPAKPEMTRNEFSERYEQMNHDALSLADVDFLQRASDTDFTKYISDTVGLTVIHLFYLSESKIPLSLADVNRDELHYLIQTD